MILLEIGNVWYSTLKEKSVLTQRKSIMPRPKVLGTINIKDYLAYNNNLDMGPFVWVKKYNFDRNKDIFKTRIFVPGLTIEMFFENGRKFAIPNFPHRADTLHM